MPWGRDYDEYPECPECGDASGECECDRPFNHPVIYFEFKERREMCVSCKIKPRYFYEDGDDYDLCADCLNRLDTDEEVNKHIINSVVIA